MHFSAPSPLEEWVDDLFVAHDIHVWIKRDDLIHPLAGGNKIRKLKYQLTDEALRNKRGIRTFGGPVSNHLVATAFLANMRKIPIRTIIRGERVDNPILHVLEEWGADMQFLSRSDYPYAMHEADPEWLTIPMGGTHPDAVKGIAEMVDEIRIDLPDSPLHVCVPFGSGGTSAGLASRLNSDDHLWIYPALKGPDLAVEVNTVFTRLGVSTKATLHVVNQAAGKGFAKKDLSLWYALCGLASQTGIWWDPVYNGKMVLLFREQVRSGQFPSGSHVVLVHTGGLPGLIGYRSRFQLADMPHRPIFPGE